MLQTIPESSATLPAFVYLVGAIFTALGGLQIVGALVERLRNGKARPRASSGSGPHSSQAAAIADIAERVADLHEWHDDRDEQGRLTWKPWKTAEKLDRLQHAITSGNAEIVSELKGIKTELEGGRPS